MRVQSLSGGELRRLSIGCDGLLTAPLLMFLDEPTSGLSSTVSESLSLACCGVWASVLTPRRVLLQDALEVVQCLHGLANDSDYTIICTIHQPPAEVFVHFTRTILLSGGELVYSGRRRYLPDFFRESGCDIGGVSAEAGALSPAGSISSPGTASKRENIKNLADKMMDWITVKEHADALSAAFKKSDFHASLLSEIKRGKALATLSAAKLAAKDGHQEVEILDASDAEAPTARSLCAQVRIVFRREFTSLWRSFGAFHMPVVATIISAVIQGLTFWQMPHSADSARDRHAVQTRAFARRGPPQRYRYPHGSHKPDGTLLVSRLHIQQGPSAPRHVDRCSVRVCAYDCLVHVDCRPLVDDDSSSDGDHMADDGH